MELLILPRFTSILREVTPPRKNFSTQHPQMSMCFKNHYNLETNRNRIKKEKKTLNNWIFWWNKNVFDFESNIKIFAPIPPILFKIKV